MQKNETGLLTPHTKINSKWLRDLNIRRGTVNFTEENTAGAKFRGLCLGLSEGFMTFNPKAREGKRKEPNGTVWIRNAPAQRVYLRRRN